MRRIDETTRVVALVGAAVACGLTVAAAANGSADPQSSARVAISPDPASREAPRGEQALPSARPVRIVYAGPLVATGGGSERRTVPAFAAAAAGSASRPEADTPAVTGSLVPAAPVPPSRPGQLAALGSALPADADPREGDAEGALDLNTAPVASLDALGGGRIGKAIARARPYSAPEDLVRKRVLIRAAFARIRDQVTVR